MADRLWRRTAGTAWLVWMAGLGLASTGWAAGRAGTVPTRGVMPASISAQRADVPGGGCTESSVAGKERQADGASLQHLGDVQGDPMQQLQGLVMEASRRSAEVGASRLLGDAAEFDLAEIQASRKPRVTLFGSAAYALNQQSGRPDASGLQGNVGVNVSAPLFDGGRLNALDDWRKRLAEAARLGQGATAERVALEAV